MRVASKYDTEDGLRFFQVFNLVKTAVGGKYNVDHLIVQNRKSGKPIDLAERLPPSVRLCFMPTGRIEDFGYQNGEVRYGDFQDRRALAGTEHEIGHAWEKEIAPEEYREVDVGGWVLEAARGDLARGEILKKE